jgi:hypothetical protein
VSDLPLSSLAIRSAVAVRGLSADAGTGASARTLAVDGCDANTADTEATMAAAARPTDSL